MSEKIGEGVVNTAGIVVEIKKVIFDPDDGDDSLKDRDVIEEETLFEHEVYFTQVNREKYEDEEFIQAEMELIVTLANDKILNETPNPEECILNRYWTDVSKEEEQEVSDQSETQE